MNALEQIGRGQSGRARSDDGDPMALLCHGLSPQARDRTTGAGRAHASEPP